MVRQLYHLGVIDAFSGTLRMKEAADQVKPYDVKISPELLTEVKDVLNALNLPPIEVVCVLLSHTLQISSLLFPLCEVPLLLL